jgi:putative PIN family toxin of toxin-antitoxin system
VRVVFDTNIYVSALTFAGGRGEQAPRLAIEERIELLVSPAILVELARILREKFGWSEDRINDACRLIGAAATPVRPKARLSILPDEPDNRILECAAEGSADQIVTGDKHLLALGSYGGAKILRLSSFLAVFE